MSDYTKLLNCLCCNNNKLIKILDLEDQPLANSYLSSKSEKENYYPLALNYCRECTHLQLTHAVNPDLLFKNYLYVSGTTKTLRDYFDSFVLLTENYIKKENPKILEIACNDGSQLNSYKNCGYKTYGIDPATNLYSTSSKDHEIVCDYFSDESVSKLSSNQFDLIVAQNVFAHNDYPLHFLNLCKKYITNDGYIFIQTSQSDMIEGGQFDTIYHEHLSFFSPHSMLAILERAGLYLHDIVKTSIHGNSWVFVISKKENKVLKNQYLDKKLEEEQVMFFASGAKKIADDLKETLLKFKKDGIKIIGYGAAAKGNTLLNFAQIDLDLIVDDNPLKHGLYTPGRKIQIIGLNDLNESSEKEIVWVPLSWNFFDEIKSKVENYRNKNNIFVKYFPQVTVL